MGEAMDFLRYMSEFEHYVVIPGLEQGLFGKKVYVPFRGMRMENSALGRLLGTRLQWETPAAIEYFGLVKRSTGFMALGAQIGDLRLGVDVPLVNFSAIKDKHIVQLRPELLIDFPAFKQEIITVRFPQGGKDGETE